MTVQPIHEDDNNLAQKPGEANAPEEELLPEEPVENTGMEMGVTFKRDREQDLDDLVHQQGSLKKDEIPPPEEI